MRKRHKLKIKRIEDPCYFKDVFFVYDFTEEEINKWFKKNKISLEWTKGTSGKHLVADKNGYETYYIFVKGQELTSWVEATLGHEVLHHTFMVLEKSGIKYCEESEEAFTYYWQYIFNKCLKLLYKIG